jgi:acyl dehydratase
MPDLRTGAAVVSQRSFDTAAQQRFARVSGDWNPLHLDPALARRMQYGAPIVHGMHFVLWALDALAASLADRVIARISVRFIKPLYLNELATLRVVRFKGERLRVAVEVEGALLATLNLELTDAVRDAYPAEHETEADDNSPDMSCETEFACLARMRGTIDLRGRIAAAAELFGTAARCIGDGRVAALAALSRLVGMNCPGLHSVFAGFAVQCTDAPGNLLEYAVVSSDSKLRVLRMDVAGVGISGSVEAFARRAPAAQATSEAVAHDVVVNEFANGVALIVGGSRGLGEATAKIIAAGGAHTVITYATGRDDAQRVALEIAAAGGTCSLLRYDATEPAGPQLAHLEEMPQTVYYYATGPIFDRKLHAYEPERFRRFCRYYVDGFADLCFAIATRSDQPLAVLYPSSIFVETRPRDLTEYAMAKAAGEVLCVDLERSVPRLHISAPRLPRMSTDQTATIADVPAQDARAVLLPLIRALQLGSAIARR